MSACSCVDCFQDHCAPTLGCPTQCYGHSQTCVTCQRGGLAIDEVEHGRCDDCMALEDDVQVRQ